MGERDCYLGRVRECGCVVAAIVDNPDHTKDVARTIREWIADGLTIERATTQAVRASEFGCTHEPKQERLPDAD